MRSSVFVIDWEQQCCGQDFSVGDTVEWQVGRDDGWVANRLGDLAPDGLLVEEHHNLEPMPGSICGTVIDIQNVLFRTRETAQCTFEYEPNSSFLSSTQIAERWVQDDFDRKFAGYLVTVAATVTRHPAAHWRVG